MPRPPADRTDSRQIHIWLSNDTHKKLRIRAAEIDSTVQDLVVEAVENLLKTKKRAEK